MNKNYTSRHGINTLQSKNNYVNQKSLDNLLENSGTKYGVLYEPLHNNTCNYELHMKLHTKHTSYKLTKLATCLFRQMLQVEQ